MNKIIFRFIILTVVSLFVFSACKSKQHLAKISEQKMQTSQNSSLNVILNPPVNSVTVEQLEEEVYKNDHYQILQTDDQKFKENAPFIEYLDQGKRERLWFTSSRADQYYLNRQATNLYQQVYFCEREVGEGKAPNQGWGEVQRFELKTDNPYFSAYYEMFNQAGKGTLALAGDKMIVSCEHVRENEANDFRDLWEVSRINDEFTNPKPISELSGVSTWESQPTLSSDGKHLFFLSNRKVLKDQTVLHDTPMNAYHLFYSFYEEGKWRLPKLVEEFVGQGDIKSPSLKYDDQLLYLSLAAKGGDYDIYEVEIELKEQGGYELNLGSFKMFSQELVDLFAENEQSIIKLNDSFDQQYPFYYYNPVNALAPRALYWASNDTLGYYGFDLYACTVPYTIDYQVAVVDRSTTFNDQVIDPIIKISGAKSDLLQEEKYSTTLYAGLSYLIQGGSTTSEENGTYFCDLDPSYIFVGYSEIQGNNPDNRFLHNKSINGPVINAESCSDGKLKLFYAQSDTVFHDTIFITKVWKKKPFCPGKLNIEPKHKSIAYFQTGYWEVNTPEKLKRDLETLHEGFKINPENDLYNPLGGIERIRSDYKAFQWENPIYPVKKGDKYSYSIANARWIELHPNNRYWGDFAGYPGNNDLRMQGRKERIEQYITYAQKVDENLNNLVDTIQDKYIDLLLKHKDHKPKLLIEIFAVSDNREVRRGWYIGDPIEYRGSDYLENEKRFVTEKVRIIPPVVDEENKVLEHIEDCSINLNAAGNNGSKLGLALDRTDQNTNLSRLRAWFGYKEVYDRLKKSEKFVRYLDQGKVALPDNELSYDDADIIIITRGRREDGDVLHPENPYPGPNNPNGTGYYDYDKIRRIEIQTRLLFEKEEILEIDYCCEPFEE